MKNFNIFNRWSFNLLVLFFLGFWLIYPIFYFVDICYKGDRTTGEYGVGMLFWFIATYFLYQCIALITTLVLIILERKPNFRIKNIFITKITNNLFYKIISSLVVLAECLLTAFILPIGIQTGIFPMLLSGFHGFIMNISYFLHF